MLTMSPLTQKKIRSFKHIKRGYWSFIILTTMLVLSLFAELFINSKALMVKYDGDYYFPVVSDVYLAATLVKWALAKPIIVSSLKSLPRKAVITM
jgi:ABC-type uncharacterized transport system, permease component